MVAGKRNMPSQVVAAILLFFCFASQVADACSTFAAGKKATADGSVILSHSDDAEPSQDRRLIFVPAMDHPANSMRPIYYANEAFPRFTSQDFGEDYYPNTDTGAKLSTPIGFIPQVPKTFSYQDTSYGVINEHNVAIGESTCSAMFQTCGNGTNIGCETGRTIGQALLSIDSLTKLAMERTTTARDAVKLMGGLAEKYGFYGTQDPNGAGEALQVGDADEVFTFNILADPTGTSAIWAARRVPDENVTVLANMFTIREIDPNDEFNCLHSKNIFSIAQERGWWKPGEVLDFTRVYSNGEYAAQYYSGRRMWGGFRLIAPSLKLPAEYNDLRYDRMWPWSAKPDKLITPQDVMRYHRDWYAGTPYDMTKGLAAGPFGSPDRWATHPKAVTGGWERSITIYRSDNVFVHHLRKPDAETLPKEVAGVTWYAAGAAHYAPFLPVPSGVHRSLAPLKAGIPHRMDSGSMSWAIRKIGSICQLRFDKMHPIVEEHQHLLEGSGAALVERAAKGQQKSTLSEAFEEFAETSLKKWHDLAEELLFRFDENTDILQHTSVHDASLGYPDAWLTEVGFKNGPPKPPVEMQCPPHCPPSEAPIVI